MRTLGTVYEWVKMKPEVRLTNRTLLQEGTYVSNLKHHPEYIEATAPCYRPDDVSRVMIHFGNQCPYMNKGKFPFSCYFANAIHVGGGCTVLSEHMAQDPNWEEYTE